MGAREPLIGSFIEARELLIGNFQGTVSQLSAVRG